MSKFSELINKDIPVLIDFFAEWCGPCKMMNPILKNVKEELGNQVSIIKINIDKNHNIVNAYQIRGVPTFILFYQGKQIWRQSGMIQKEELIRIISSANQ